MSAHACNRLFRCMRHFGSGLALLLAVSVAGPSVPVVGVASAQAPQAPVSAADHGGGAHAFFIPGILRQRGLTPGGTSGASAPGQSVTGSQGENAGQAPLTYHGGSVMRDPTNYVIIWNPPGSTFSATYQKLIEQYFMDVGDTPFMQINSQYGDKSGAPVPNTNHYGGTWVDTTNAYPHAGTVADPLVGQDIRDEVDRAIAANPTWQPPGLNTMYFVYLGHNIIECFKGAGDTFGCFAGTDAGGNSPPAADGPPNTVAGAGTYCAYHSSFGNKVYATMPYASDGACYGSPSTYPNGVDQDIVLSPTSHEQFEAYSDPNLDAWYDAGGNENGDKCAYTYGNVEPDGTNFVLWGNRYQLQEEWSNDTNTAYGCFKRAGQNPTLAINGDLSFGTVPRGTTSTKDILIQNSGGGDLNALNFRIATAGSAFSIDPASPRWGTLLSGENVTVKVNFAPSALATSTSVASNSLVIDTDQIGFETQSIATSATIGLPKAALSGSLNFGTVCAASPVDEFVTVTNTGAAPLTINSVSITAGSTAGLIVLSPPSLPQTIPVGGSLTFTVRYTAGSTGGAISGSVDVFTDDPANPHQLLSITGTNGAANATISSSALDFGGVPTDNRTSPFFADKSVIIGNTGTCALSVNSVGPITGTNAGDFNIVGAPALPVFIGAGSSLTLTVRFNPAAPGLRSASLAVGTSDPANPTKMITLTGNGLVPAIQTSAARVAYVPTVIQSQVPGYTGTTQGLKVTNVGQAELIVDVLATSGAPFIAPGPLTPPARYAPSDSFNEPITFAPTAVGKFNGSFTVADTNPEGPVSSSVSLCGEGVMRGIRVLAVNAAGVPFTQVAKLHLQAHGTAQNVNENVMNLPLVPVTTSCDPTAQRQYENQSLPATDTANQRSSYYDLSVTAGGKATTVTFTLGVAEFKTIMVTIK
jgi:hypothetical protein